MNKILIIEDDNDIALLEKDYLEMNDFNVEIVEDGYKAINLLKEVKYDLIILDIMLPNINGYDICKMIREELDIPIIMVTAKNEMVDKVRGLGLGSDDYITKPFDPAELVARVKAHINTYQRLKGKENEIVVRDIKILTDSYKVFKNGKEIKLPNKEFELLNYLALNPNIVFSKESLFEQIWGLSSDGEDATVTVHINRIREKIEDDPSNPKIIETVWGAGYKFNK